MMMFTHFLKSEYIVIVYALIELESCLLVPGGTRNSEFIRFVEMLQTICQVVITGQMTVKSD